MEKIADFRARIRSRCSTNLRCGSHVIDKQDPRHVGRVDAISCGIVTVRWENGWKSEVPQERIQLAESDHDERRHRYATATMRA